MLGSLRKSHLLAKLAPVACLIHLLFGFIGATQYRGRNETILECTRSLDYGAFGFALFALVSAVFLARKASNPGDVRERAAAQVHRVVAAVLLLLAVALVVKGFVTEGSVDPSSCGSTFR